LKIKGAIQVSQEISIPQQWRASVSTGPDGGTTPFRGEKNTNWEGSYRVPAMVRWPGQVQPRTEINDIVSAEDWVPTLVAAAGDPDIKNKLLQGYDAGGKTFKVHLDGYDQRDLLPNTIGNNTVSTSALTNLLLNSMKLPAALSTNTIIAAIKSPCMFGLPSLTGQSILAHEVLASHAGSATVLVQEGMVP
jgi:Sulfatase